MRGKKRAGDDKLAKAKVPARGVAAVAKGKRAREKAPAKPARGRTSKTTLNAGAEWPFPVTNRAGEALSQEAADEREHRHLLLQRQADHAINPPIVPEPISENGLPKRLRRPA